MLKAKDYEKLLNFQSQIYYYDTDIRHTILQAMQNLFQKYPMAFFLTDENEQYINPISINLDSETMNSYKKYYFKTDIFHTINIQRKLLSKQIVHVTDIMSRNSFEKTEFYNDNLRKIGVGDEIAMQLHHQGQLLGVIGIMKPRILGDFTEKEIKYAKIIREHISNLLKKSLIKLNLEHENKTLLNFIKESPMGMVLVDNNFRPIQYNQNALQYINEICNNDSANPLDEKLTKIFTEKIYFKGSTYGNSIQTNIENYSIKVVPFAVPDFSQGIKPFYSVYIFKNNNNKALDCSILKSRYNLTTRECELVFYLLEGYSNKKIADELYISPHTVKTHIQNIFKKMDCISRGEVINKVIPND